MFRIRQIHIARTPQDQQVLASVIRLYVEAFSSYPEYANKISELLVNPSSQNFEIILLVAQGSKNRILGFSLSFYFPSLKYAYLDYIVSDPNRRARGYGVALYERNKQVLKDAGCLGIFMDVPPDDKDKLKEPNRLKVNQKRMAFYERLNAFPVIGTKYDSVSHKANQGYYTYLVYDNFVSSKPLRATKLKKVIVQILSIKGGMQANDSKVKQILSSIVDDPVRLREPRYADKDAQVVQKSADYAKLDLIETSDVHQIHHLKEKGYVEKPARVDFILKGLNGFQCETHKVKHFGDKHITAVHQTALFEFLKNAQKELFPGQMVYPNVFPIRRPERIPKNWEMRAGYYCIDTFTPVTASAYRAARYAVDAALTAAECIAKGSQHVYVVCRPPGHHAERRSFGGFCYFNNAAIAANYLSRLGKVAFIDIDYHHGNGSQDIFYHRNDVYFISIHGHPRVSYPYFSGFSDEFGVDEGKGFNRNFPLFPGTDDSTYLKALDQALNLFRRYKPEFLVISLGYDMMAGDPTGAFEVTAKGVQAMGEKFAALGLPTLVIQEGGYTLRNLRYGATAFFKGLLKKS